MIDYTECSKATDSLQIIPDKFVSTAFKTPLTDRDAPRWSLTNTTTKNLVGQDMNTTICTLQFTLPSDLNPPVLFYYRLTNFYQNHRRYVKSLDESQLAGNVRTKSQLDSTGECSPLIANEDGKPYYPCGLIANSMFNDTFTSPVLLNVAGGSGSSNKTYVMTTDGIAWGSDRKRYGKTQYTPDQVVPPPNWVDHYGENYTVDTMPDLTNWGEFHVWMRTAGLPMFSKLARRNDKDVMTAGTYQVHITYNFKVMEYAGTKSMVISTSTVMGGKNPFLGIAYIVVSGLCVLLGALFTARHLFQPRYILLSLSSIAVWRKLADLSVAENLVITPTSHGITTGPLRHTDPIKKKPGPKKHKKDDVFCGCLKRGFCSF